MAMNSTIGCDLGDKFTHTCLLDASGEIVGRQRVATTPAAVKKFFEAQSPSLVVIETGTHARWVARLAEAAGHRLLVANPRQLPLIYCSNTKSDRNDAECLARLGRVDPKLLAPVKLRSERSHADLALLKTRDLLVSQRTVLINHLRGIVKPFGARLPGGDAESFHERVAQAVPRELLQAARPVLSCLAHLAVQIRRFDKAIEQLVKKSYPDAALLQQVSGVGPITSVAFVLTLDDKSRFRKSREVGAFVGLAPRHKQSGDADPQLRITKAGDPFLRRLLVNCAQYILGHFGPDTDLRRWGLKLAGQGGKNSKKRAVVAVARKLAVLLHRLWVTGEDYQPLGYGQHATAVATA
ncbi:MAG: IS110 family RNA-guided transposase [Myxococcales bacterium]